MNRNTITKILVIIILIVLLSFATRASILATIGVQAISFVDPDAAKAVQTVLTAYQLISSPTSAITSQVIGQITGQIMGEIEGASPEAAKAIKTYQQIQGWVDQGAKITKELQLDKDSQLASGAIQMGDQEEDVSKLVNSDLKEGSIKVSNMEISSKEEGGDITFTAKESGRAEINGKKYENLKEGSKIITDREGNIKEADMTFNKPTSIEIGGKKLQVDKGMRVVYNKDGTTDVFGKDQIVQADQQKIKINGENSIKLEGQKITGKDFTLDEKRFTGMEGKSAEATLVEEGYLMGKNTQMEDSRMIINSEKGDVLYSKMCENVVGFDNYVSPCKSTLIMEGEGFSVQMKEGRHFGLDIEKNDVLKYEMEGGKIVINNGEQTVYTDLGKSVRVINGEIVTTYDLIDGEPQELINPDSLYGDYDVAMSTKLASESFDEETIITTQNEQMEGGQVENAKENVYVCPAGLETSTAAVTGAFFTKKCPQSVTVATTNPEITPGSAKEGDDWGGEKIIGVYDRTATSLVVHTRDASGNINIYRINTNGMVERKVLGDWVVDKEYVLSDPEKKWFGLTAGSKAQDAISNQKVNKIDDTAKGITEKIGGGAKVIWGESYKLKGNKLFDSGGNFVDNIVKQPDGTYETPDGAARYKEFPGGVIREIR